MQTTSKLAARIVVQDLDGILVLPNVGIWADYS